MDIISNLPNEIINHIGSFLSAKEAAFARVLSKRWRNLFTIVQELHFHIHAGFNDSLNNEGRLEDFVDGVLALPVTTRIKKFSVKWRFHDIKAAQYDHINRCLIHVLKLGVMDLTLRIYGNERGYSLPFEVFTCKTVEKLKLGSCFAIEFLPENTYLPSLKYLSLDSIRFYDESGRCCAFNKLISASPELEELVIKGIDWERWKWSFTISSSTLRRLTMKRTEWYFYFGDDDPLARIRLDSRGLSHEFNSLVLDTPALTYLDYEDYIPKEYPIVNLNSLVEAKLGLRASYDHRWEKNHLDDFDPMKLINGLKHVEMLDLDNETMEMIYLYGEANPVFENVVRVSVHIANLCWECLTILLKKCPKLKTLIIENRWRGGDGSVCEVCVMESGLLSSCPLEVLKITPYNGSSKELKQMEYILGELSCLELVELHSRLGDETASYGGSLDATESFFQMQNRGQIFLRKCEFSVSFCLMTVRILDSAKSVVSYMREQSTGLFLFFIFHVLNQRP